MGRAEKRKAERKNRLNEKKKLLFSRKEIKDIQKDSRNIASTFTVETLMTCFALAEHRLYGFGKTRVLRTLKYIDDLMEDVMSGEISIDEYKEQLEKEVGVKIQCDVK